jgi:hypothetical protein
MGWLRRENVPGEDGAGRRTQGLAFRWQRKATQEEEKGS